MTDAPQHLIDAMLNGSLDDAGRRDLSQWIAADSAHAVEYARQVTLHAQLRHEYASPGPIATTVKADRVTSAVTPVSPRAFRYSVLSAAVAAAILIAFTAVAIYLFSASTDPQQQQQQRPDPRSERTVATLIESRGAGVTYNDDSAHDGGEYARGSYTIESGSAELLLTSRVTLGMRGPTRLRIHDPMTVTLEHGSASFRCPSDAKNFTVQLLDGTRIVDLGTAFTVNVGLNGESSVTVTEGSVEVIREPTRQVVRAGEMARIAKQQITTSAFADSNAVLALARDPASADDLIDPAHNLYGYAVEVRGATIIPGRAAGHRALAFAGPPQTQHAVIRPGQARGIDFSSAFSVAMWVKVDVFTSQYEPIVFADSTAWRLVHDGGGRVNFATTWAETPDGIRTNHLVSRARVDDGRWHWIVMTYAPTETGVTKHLYIDGRLDVRDANAQPIRLKVGAMLLGANPFRDARFAVFGGAIGELSVFDRALTAREVVDSHRDMVALPPEKSK